MALVALALVVPVRVEAQAVAEFFIVPAMIVGHARGPMYLKWRFNPGGLDVNYWQIYYGSLPTMIVCVEAEQVDLDWLAAQDGVYTFPTNLDAQPSPAELSEVETALEGQYIPADWLLPNMTWREVIRTVSGLMLFMGRLTTILGGQSPIDLGWSLNAQFRTLSAEHQAAIIEAFDSLGYDSSVLRDNWTLRVLLKNAADQWGSTPINFGGIVIL